MVSYYDEHEEGGAAEPAPVSLARWLEEQYLGDDRFDSIDIAEPGPLEGETLRVKFTCTPTTHFLVAVLDEDQIVRVGLATDDHEIVEAIEAAVNESGDSITEYVEDAMDADEELEHEVQHFHDDVDYFASDITYQRDEDLTSDHLRDEIIYYLDGYMTALYDFVEGEEDEEDDE